jgi:secondary thiamine-phosphate synthase enzyme
MKIVNHIIKRKTKGNGDLIDITQDLSSALKETKLKIGNLTVFVIGSTAGVITFEYEPGLIKDVQDLYEKLVPSDKQYSHDQTWGDANGFSHLRAMLSGQSFTVPFDESKLLLGTWQQVVLAEFDTRPRERKVVVQIIGE